MGMFSSLEQTLFPDQTVVVSEYLESRMKRDQVTLFDVGGADGVDRRWESVRRFCRFLTVEPDTRSSTSTSDKIFSCAVSDKKGTQTLYLTEFPPASSLHKLNESAMSVFANYPLHRIVGEQSVETISIDELLQSEGESIEFLKIDAEDHDFHVLMGAESTVESSVLGLQIECSFLPRHVSGATFNDIFPWMLERGFQLHILARESWLRKNLLWGTNSNPQLVWADAVFFIGKDRFIQRLAQLESEERSILTQKFVLTLMIYGAHDYADEVVAAVEDLVSDDELILGLRAFIQENVDSPWRSITGAVFSALVGIIVGLLGLVTWLARKPARRFMLRRLSPLANVLSLYTSRGGYLGASFPDRY